MKDKKSPLGGFRGLKSPPRGDLEGLPVALITGGSRGIGLGIAVELAKARFNLVINGVRKQEAVQPILDGLKMFGVNVAYAQGNISDKLDREKIFQTQAENAAPTFCLHSKA